MAVMVILLSFVLNRMVVESIFKENLKIQP